MQNLRVSDLLDRDVEIIYSDSAKKLMEDKVVLVTGAGGSIGSEIVNQLHQFGVKDIICVDRDEYALYKLQLTTTGSALMTDEKYILADIQNYQSIYRIIQDWKPDIVFHAAAVKHLPLLEHSPDTAVLTNVLGTENVIRASVECGVDRVVNISTDKAASPSSVLGYTKRLAEMVARSYADCGTLISSVRFGNVFASRGSFIETMQWQIANGKTITLTDPDITRYFMSIPQAACLVIEAAALANSGHTYVLDMGEPVKIIDIVNKYVSLINCDKPSIIYGNLRAGEKKHEELFDNCETRRPTSHSKISAVTVEMDPAKFREEVNWLYYKAQTGTVNKECLSKVIDDMLAKTSHAQALSRANKFNRIYRLTKRTFDLLISSILLILLFIPSIFIAIWIKADSKGPVFFKQDRVGRNKQLFKIYKFRTMRASAPKNTPAAELKNAECFITKSGNILRKMSLDELPQLINIIKGDMSIIGPRPSLWNEYKLIIERDKYNVHDVRPGISGWAQVNGRDELAANVSRKVAYDSEYVSNISFLMDLKCLYMTVLTILNNDGYKEGIVNSTVKQLQVTANPQTVFYAKVSSQTGKIQKRSVFRRKNSTRLEENS